MEPVLTVFKAKLNIPGNKVYPGAERGYGKNSGHICIINGIDLLSPDGSTVIKGIGDSRQDELTIQVQILFSLIAKYIGVYALDIQKRDKPFQVMIMNVMYSFNICFLFIVDYQNGFLFRNIFQ